MLSIGILVGDPSAISNFAGQSFIMDNYGVGTVNDVYPEFPEVSPLIQELVTLILPDFYANGRAL